MGSNNMSTTTIYILTLFVPGAFSGFPVEFVHSITPKSVHLVEPQDEERGFKFESDWPQVGEFCAQADAGSVNEETKAEGVARCEVILTNGKRKYMNLARIKNWKRTFYVKDTSGNGNFVLYFDGSPIQKKSGGVLGRLFNN